MAAVPGKKKPPTPPKPLISGLQNPTFAQNPSDCLKERCGSSFHKKGGGKDDNPHDDAVFKDENSTQIFANKIKTDETGNNNRQAREPGGKSQNANAIKCRTEKLSPKPALLPKPQASPKILATKIGTSYARPCIPKCPNNVVQAAVQNDSEFAIPLCVHSKEKQDLKLVSVTSQPAGITCRRLPVPCPLKIKAPVAKLEEFDNFCEPVKSGTPVRPPRSPKNQPLKEEVFSVFEKKPELPVKKKQCNWQPESCDSASGTSFETLKLQWETTKQKSASLGRSNAFKFTEVKSKISSLERNKRPDILLCLPQGEELSNLESRKTPIPPPRNRKKQSGDIHSIPIYAEVNYNLKKNRCQNTDSTKESTEGGSEFTALVNKEEIQEQLSVCEGRSDLPKVTTDSSSNNEVKTEEYNKKEEGESYTLISDFTEINENSSKENEANERKIVNKTGTCEDAFVVEDCDVECYKSSQVLDSGQLVNGCVISEDKTLNTSVGSVIKVDNSVCTSHQTCTVDSETKITDRVLPDNASEVNLQTEEHLAISPLLTQTEDKCSNLCIQSFMAEVHDDSALDNIELQLTKISVQDNAGNDVSNHAVEGNISKLNNIIHSTHVNESDSTVVIASDNSVESTDDVKHNISNHAVEGNISKLNNIIHSTHVNESDSTVVIASDNSVESTDDVKHNISNRAVEGSISKLNNIIHSTHVNESDSTVVIASDNSVESTDDVKYNISNHALEGSISKLNNIIHSTHVNESVSTVEIALDNSVESTDDVKHNVYMSVNNNLDNNQQKFAGSTTKESEITPQIEANLSKNRGCRFSSSSLPSKRKLEIKELGKLHRRRQSWSSCKDDSPSPNKPNQLPKTHKRKSKSHSWWCDEGELSSGALGDLDSSDNAARQSSFEEVSLTGSDVEDCSTPVRNKLSTWWGSFGKGHFKHKPRRDSSSQFYCDRPDSYDRQSTGTKQDGQVPASFIQSPTVSVEEVETDGFNSFVHSSSRPGSSLSALSALDADQKSDAPVSEDSFEIYPHSESDNESEKNSEYMGERKFQLEVTCQEKKAFNIAQELMTSERVFIDVLKLLNIDFREAVHRVSSEQKYAIIPDAELCKILNSLPQLQSLNEDLLHDLEHRIDSWNSVQKISDVIVRKGPFLKLYTTYIQNFELQCNYLDESCQKYPRFAKTVKDFESSPRCQKLSLKHYMLKPVQRIPQYRLLLEDYLHHLSPSSPDLEDTRTALKIVCDVADHANRSIKLGDHLSKLLQLQSQLGNYEIIKPGRVFLKDGELFKLSRKGMQPRYFILLNDCLLYTSYYGTVQSSGLKVNYELPLNSMKVSIPQAEDYHNEFSIISVKRSFTLSAQSLNERQEWVDALQKAITDYASRQMSFQNVKIPSLRNEDCVEPIMLGQEAPVWIQDRRVTMCQSCTAEFTVTFRRHHCRACGKVVCGDCSDFRAPLQYMQFQLARVCEECYVTLLKEARDSTSKLNQAMKCELGYSIRITDYFKSLGPVSGKKVKKYIPQRLKEVTANDSGSQMSGWLQRRTRRSWKRFWFVLKEQVLYVYKASEDVVALESIPVLGYTVEPMKERHFQLYEGIDAKLVFQLAHLGQQPLVFHADSESLANRWIAAMNEATVLK